MAARIRAKRLAGFKALDQFGWTTKHAWDLLGSRPKVISDNPPSHNLTQAQAGERLMDLAADYMSYLKVYPNRVHVFPLLGSLFQYQFARGVRDAVGMKRTRLWAVPIVKGKPPGRLLKRQIKSMRLKERGIVWHDYVHLSDSILHMLNAGKLYPHGIQFGGKQRPTEPLPTNMMQLHYLTESQAFPYASIKLPHSGYDYVVAPHELYTKTYAPDLGGQITRDSGVSKADVKIIKQAVYTAGRAAAEELMKKKKA